MQIGRFAFLGSLMVLAGCSSASDHAKQVRAGQEGERLTAGAVQREIRQGMPAGDVAAALGSPNIVTRNPDGTATWVYDRISTETVYSTSQGGISALILGGGVVGDAILGGGAAPSYGQSAGAASRSQRTLTVVVKFDPQDRVRDFSYHQSSF